MRGCIPLLCPCGHITEVPTLIFKKKKEAGLLHNCASCKDSIPVVAMKRASYGATESQKRSRTQEKRLATKEGARLQPGSGNVGGFEGDVLDRGKLRGEAKTTLAASYSLKLQDLITLETSARGDELPVFEIEFYRANQTRRYVVLPEWAYDALMTESGRRK